MAIQKASPSFTALLLTLLAAVAQAQPQLQHQTPTASIGFRPGDTVRIRLSLEKPLKVESGHVQFVLGGEPIPPQRDMLRFLNCTNMTSSSPVEYEFSGTIPEGLASGEYRIRLIVLQSQGVTKTYDSDFPQQVRFTVHNEKKIGFPAIEDLQLIRPSGGTIISGKVTISGSTVIK